MSHAIDSARQRLTTYDQALVDEFSQVAQRLSESSVDRPLVDLRLVDEWASLCAAIATRGWHTWESSLLFIKVTLPLLGLDDSTRSVAAEPASNSANSQGLLLECGRYGLHLAGNSHELSSTYFSTLARMSAVDAMPMRRDWQQIGIAIETVCPRRPAILLDYYQLSGDLINLITGQAPRGIFHGDEFGMWLELISRITRAELHSDIDSDRIGELLQGVLGLCRRYPGELDWQYGLRIPIDYLVDFYQVYPRINTWSHEELDTICQIVEALPADPGNVDAFLQQAATQLAGYDRDDRINLLRACRRLGQSEHAPVLALLSSAGQLPVSSPMLLDAWIEKGMEVSRTGPQVAEAYFGLESATAVETLHLLRGQVNFDEQRRLFQLYSEGITGRKLHIEVSPRESDDFREFSVTRTDGQYVYLPEQISTFPQREQNAALYKVSLLHQLGLFEAGTFDYGPGKTRNPFGDLFGEFEQPQLASALFQVLEDGRVDWFILRRYKGIRKEMQWLMGHVLSQRPIPELLSDPVKAILEAIVQYTLGASRDRLSNPEFQKILDIVAELQLPGATVHDTVRVMRVIYSLLPGQQGRKSDAMSSEMAEDQLNDEALPEGVSASLDWIPEPVDYRGSTNPESVSLGMALQELEEAIADLLDDQGMDGASSIIDAANLKIEQFRKGNIDNASGMFLTDLAEQMADGSMDPSELEEELDGLSNLLQLENKAAREAGVFKYDEWDYQINDYRKNWCRLHEIILESDDEVFVSKTLLSNKSLLGQIKKQMQMLKPELQRKVKGLPEGEEIDLEGAIEAIIDKRTGVSPTEKIYIQRQRKERDVSALFLLDMSASTDDVLPDPPGKDQAEVETVAADEEETDDFLYLHYPRQDYVPPKKTRRIIDLEKESVVLMAEALEELGDNYSICGFSGYGRDQVDYYVCKSFSERYQAEVKGRLGAIKPCRSTRMGPAIRHATRELARTESRIKALIIISDGYPQDFDYGSDRNSREYGMQDTSKALNEARHKGVQTFCLTVDQSGHDYLRDMCPDQQYMVIRDLAQLPHELSKVYQGLTT